MAANLLPPSCSWSRTVAIFNKNSCCRDLIWMRLRRHKSTTLSPHITYAMAKDTLLCPRKSMVEAIVALACLKPLAVKCLLSILNECWSNNRALIPLLVLITLSAPLMITLIHRVIPPISAAFQINKPNLLLPLPWYVVQNYYYYFFSLLMCQNESASVAMQLSLSKSSLLACHSCYPYNFRYAAMVELKFSDTYLLPIG